MIIVSILHRDRIPAFIIPRARVRSGVMRYRHHHDILPLICRHIPRAMVACATHRELLRYPASGNLMLITYSLRRSAGKWLPKKDTKVGMWGLLLIDHPIITPWAPRLQLSITGTAGWFMGEMLRLLFGLRWQLCARCRDKFSGTAL